jgi:hypothetical protein
MKYQKIASLVPAGEHFEEKAVNEGVWLSVAHIEAIESVLAADPDRSEIDRLTTELSAAQQANATLTQSMETLNAAKQSDTTIIQELRDKVAEFEAGSSGGGTNIRTGKEGEAEHQGGRSSKLPRYDDPNHPAQKLAARFVKK